MSSSPKECVKEKHPSEHTTSSEEKKASDTEYDPKRLCELALEIFRGEIVRVVDKSVIEREEAEMRARWIGGVRSERYSKAVDYTAGRSGKNKAVDWIQNRGQK